MPMTLTAGGRLKGPPANWISGTGSGRLYRRKAALSAISGHPSTRAGWLVAATRGRLMLSLARVTIKQRVGPPTEKGEEGYLLSFVITGGA